MRLARPFSSISSCWDAFVSLHPLNHYLSQSSSIYVNMQQISKVNERTSLLGGRWSTSGQRVAHLNDPEHLPSNVAQPANAQAGEMPTSQLVLIIGSCYLGIILAALDGTMVATLTASISASYNSLSLLAWLAASYYIACSVLQPLSGKLTDIYGRRAGSIVCHIMFCLGNLICGLAQNESTVIFGRIVAGLGGGGMNSIPLFVTNDLVPLRRRGVWQGFNNICFGIGSGLGGFFGGKINDTLGWRWAFIMLMPLTIISALLVAFFLRMPTKDVKESDLWDKWKRIDFAGSITLAAAIVLLCVGLNAGGNTVPWNHPVVLVSLPLSAVLFAIFVYIEARVAEEPVILVRLFLNRTVLSACLTSWFFSMSHLALTFYSPIYFQVKGATATAAGLFLLPTSIGAAVGGIIWGWIIRASGKYYWLNILIQVLFVLPLGFAMRLDLTSPNILPVFYFFSTGFAYSGKLTVTVTALIAAVEQKQQAVVTSASYIFRGTGSTIGISVCSLVFQNILLKKLREHFSHEKNAEALIARLRNSLAEIEHLDPVMRGEVRQVYMEALNGVFTTIFALAVIGTVASLFMREYTLHKDLARTRA